MKISYTVKDTRPADTFFRNTTRHEIIITDLTDEQVAKVNALREGLAALGFSAFTFSPIYVGALSLDFTSPNPVRIADLAAPITAEEVWPIIDSMIAQIPALYGQREAHIIAKEAERETIRRNSEVLAAQREIERQEREAQKQVERERATYLDWDEENKATLNLFASLLTVADVDRDDRFTAWAKDVTNVTAADNGYAFEGAWVSKGTVEIDRRPRLFLLATTTGSRRYQTTTYSVVILNTEGRLEATDIQTDSTEAGWALRIRKPIQAKLKELGIN